MSVVNKAYCTVLYWPGGCCRRGRWGEPCPYQYLSVHRWEREQLCSLSAYAGLCFSERSQEPRLCTWPQPTNACLSLPCTHTQTQKLSTRKSVMLIWKINYIIIIFFIQLNNNYLLLCQEWNKSIDTRFSSFSCVLAYLSTETGSKQKYQMPLSKYIKYAYSLKTLTSLFSLPAHQWLRRITHFVVFPFFQNFNVDTDLLQKYPENTGMDALLVGVFRILLNKKTRVPKRKGSTCIQ